MKIKYHVIRQFQQEGELELIYCTSKKQLANLFTKPLAKDRFETLRERIGKCNFEPMRSIKVMAIKLEFILQWFFYYLSANVIVILMLFEFIVSIRRFKFIEDKPNKSYISP